MSIIDARRTLKCRACVCHPDSPALLVDDAEGNRTKRTKTSDGSYEKYTWDHRNRLTKVEFFNSSHTLTKSIEYFYDMFGRMVRRTLDSNGSGSGGVSDTWWAAFDRIHSTLEFDGNQVTDVTHRYLWGQFQDDLLADEIVTSTSSAGTIQWGLSDQVHTIRDIGRWDSGTSDFEIANHRVFDTFGKLESEMDSSIDLAFAFNGKWTESETGYTHHLNRWYDAVIGKWLSEDPIGFSAGDANLTRFVGNQALSHFDPDGLEELMSKGTGSGKKEDSRHKFQNQQEGENQEQEPEIIASHGGARVIEVPSEVPEREDRYRFTIYVDQPEDPGDRMTIDPFRVGHTTIVLYDDVTGEEIWDGHWPGGHKDDKTPYIESNWDVKFSRNISKRQYKEAKELIDTARRVPPQTAWVLIDGTIDIADGSHCATWALYVAEEIDVEIKTEKEYTPWGHTYTPQVLGEDLVKQGGERRGPKK